VEAAQFVHWYNEEHRHSGIRYVTPAQRHDGRDQAILTARHAVYQEARRCSPRRWSGRTRDWTPPGAVTLNPERQATIRITTSHHQLSGSAGAPALVRFASQASRPDDNPAMARNGGQERSAAARNHAQRPFGREHGEDGEHRTLPEVSTMAASVRSAARD
jgi:hypothetical protein